MANPSENLEARALHYVNTHGMRLERQLGYGKDGTVYSTDFFTAVKAFARLDAFRRELAVYRRLKERGIDEIVGHSVPLFIMADETLMIIEMSVVDKPYILDFASAYLDYPPEFSEEVLAEWEADKAELFGRNWSKVKVLMAALENACDIYLFDVHPGNIAFADEAV